MDGVKMEWLPYFNIGICVIGISLGISVLIWDFVTTRRRKHKYKADIERIMRGMVEIYEIRTKERA